jgi:hypothetical protein
MRLLLGAMLTTLLAGCAIDDEFVDASSRNYPYAQPYPSCVSAPSSSFTPASYSQPVNTPLPAQSAEPPR